MDGGFSIGAYLGFYPVVCWGGDPQRPNTATKPSPKQQHHNQQSSAFRNQLIGALKNLSPECLQALGGQDAVNGLIDKLKDPDQFPLDIVLAGTDAGDLPIPNFPAAQGGSSVTFNGMFKFMSKRYGGKLLSYTVIVNNWNGWTDAQTYHSIILGPAFLNPAQLDPDGLAAAGGNVGRFQQATLMHEFMHLVNDMDDQRLASQFGLQAKGYDVSSSSAASNSLQRFFEGGCKNAQ
jgi:hypothetical protein